MGVAGGGFRMVSAWNTSAVKSQAFPFLNSNAQNHRNNVSSIGPTEEL